ncbi:hypothetical protein BJV82DRAFT_40959 [Fennellomyces sp. T-0311]|nr:hypothetical protein BJV82DRAFT_40959 [Fennellomyces sp. T-0311]
MVRPNPLLLTFLHLASTCPMGRINDEHAFLSSTLGVIAGAGSLMHQQIINELLCIQAGACRMCVSMWPLLVIIIIIIITFCNLWRHLLIHLRTEHMENKGRLL